MMMRHGLSKRVTNGGARDVRRRDEHAALAEVDALGSSPWKSSKRTAIAAQRDAELFVESVDRVQRAVQRHVEAGVGEDARELLRFAERVTHDDRLAVVAQ